MAKMPTTDEWVEQIGNKAINEFVYEGRTLKEWIDLMASGKLVVTPDNATNGDMIKALFPNTKIQEGERYTIWDVGTDNVSFWNNWWNAPYKRGDIK